MKKLLITALLFVFQLNYGMDIVPYQNAWRQKFNSLDKQTYNDSVVYDLDLRLWQDDREDVVHNYASLLVHGFSASPTTMIEYARFDGPHRIPGDAFTFAFKDKFNNSGSFICSSSFGQINDIKSLLVAIRAAYDCGLRRCNLFGQSRGGGTIPNALSVLNTEVTGWDAGFTDIIKFFKNNDRDNILQMIKNGVVVLDTPMVTAQAGINAHVNKIFHGIFFEKFVSDFIHDYLLSIITCGNYSPNGMQALTSIDNLPEDLKVLVGYQKDDGSVGNDYDKVFTQALIKRLSENNVWVVLGNDGGKEFDDATWQVLHDANDKGIIHKRWGIIGLPYRAIPAHNAGFITLLESGIVNEFLRFHDGSFLDDKAKLAQGAGVLKRSRPQQDSLDSYFIDENYNMNSYERHQPVAQSKRYVFSIGAFMMLLNLLLLQYNI